MYLFYFGFLPFMMTDLFFEFRKQRKKQTNIPKKILQETHRFVYVYIFKKINTTFWTLIYTCMNPDFINILGKMSTKQNYFVRKTISKWRWKDSIWNRYYHVTWIVWFFNDFCCDLNDNKYGDSLWIIQRSLTRPLMWLNLQQA